MGGTGSYINKLKLTTIITGIIACSSSTLFAQDKVDEFFKSIVPKGKLSVNYRLRSETVEQDGATDDAEAFTQRLRLGYLTPEMEGFTFFIEGEIVDTINDESEYNAAGRYPSGRGKPIIADPAAEELNQLWVSFKNEGNALKVGRQIIALDNQRWIGHVGWRQNIQTYDAVTFSSSAIADWKLTYGYIDKVHRIFGDDWPDRAGPIGEFNSDTHILNATYSGFDFGKLTLFGYLVDLEEAAAVSSSTYGLLFSGSKKLTEDGQSLIYNLSFATQSDYGDNPKSYTATYFAGDFAYKVKAFQAGVGYELLGSDDGVAAVSAPLATLHAFNGWADVFLGTPAGGLKDFYLYATYKIPVGNGIVTKLFYHDYESDHFDLDLGSELNLLLAYKLTKQLTAVLKYADFEQGDPFTAASREKLTLQLDFVY